MAKNLSLADGIDNDPDFLNGNVKDGDTVVGEHIYQDIIQFFQKMIDIGGLTANGDYDNEVNDYQFIDALRRTQKLIQYLPRHVFEPVAITLDNTNTLDITDGAGSAFTIDGSVADHTIDFIFITPGFLAGERLLLYISSAHDVTISHGASVFTPEGVDMIAEAGSYVELTANASFKWEITATSKPLIKASGHIFVKEVPITGWNMNTTDSINVNLSVPDPSKVKTIVVSMFNNAKTQQYQFPYHKQGVTDGAIQAWVSIYAVGSDQILIERLVGGDFDDAAFDDADGTIIVTYTN